MCDRFLVLLYVLLALLLPIAAVAQQPVVLTQGGAVSSPTNPNAFCISDGVACITSFGEVFTENFHTGAGSALVPMYGIALPGASGPEAVKPNNPLPVITTAASSITAVGNVAEGTASTGNPMAVGCIGITSLPTAVDSGDRVSSRCDKVGRTLITTNPRELRAPGTRVSLTDTTETTVIAAAASTFHDLVEIGCTNESSTEVRVDVRDATAGTVRVSMVLAPDGGGSNKYFGPDGYPQAAANNNWTVQLSGAVSTVYCEALARKDL